MHPRGTAVFQFLLQYLLSWSFGLISCYFGQDLALLIDLASPGLREAGHAGTAIHVRDTLP